MKAMIGMSGGVDSSAAALLMQQQGYECTGATMHLISDRIKTTSPCFSQKDIDDARAVCQKLGIEHTVLHFSSSFEEKVINAFVRSYESGSTPNPCIDCNRWLKFDAMLSAAQAGGFDTIATGHYAKIEKDSNGRYLLKKAKDLKKDQSYVLYTLSQAKLAKTKFPLGCITKAEAREITQLHGFANSAKKDSQDICFVPDGDYAAFIEAYLGTKFPEGNFIGIDGTVLGQHRGLIRYTIGQRRGLGLALPEPLYVHSKSIASNTVTLCKNEELFNNQLDAANINLIAVAALNAPLRVQAKIRYNHTAAPATVWQTSADTVHIEFDTPQRAIAKGQAAVFYDGDVVIGGGEIV